MMVEQPQGLPAPNLSRGLRAISVLKSQVTSPPGQNASEGRLILLVTDCGEVTDGNQGLTPMPAVSTGKELFFR
jgi:hypothetical protein